MTIHSGHPFADSEPDEVRRFRGRLGGAVTLWTTGDGESRAGLTVSSLMVANGETAQVLALVDPDSAFHDALGRGRGLRGAGAALARAGPGRDVRRHRAGARRRLPHAEWEQTPYGPRLATATSWAYVVPVEEREVGWSVLLTCRLEEAHVLDETEPALGHRRGRFHPLGSEGD